MLYGYKIINISYLDFLSGDLPDSGWGVAVLSDLQLYLGHLLDFLQYREEKYKAEKERQIQVTPLYPIVANCEA